MKAPALVDVWLIPASRGSDFWPPRLDVECRSIEVPSSPITRSITRVLGVSVWLIPPTIRHGDIQGALITGAARQCRYQWIGSTCPARPRDCHVLSVRAEQRTSVSKVDRHVRPAPPV